MDSMLLFVGNAFVTRSCCCRMIRISCWRNSSLSSNFSAPAKASRGKVTEGWKFDGAGVVLSGLFADLEQIDAKTFLLPFLDIIRADDTSAAVTSAALDAVQKVLNCRMLGKLLHEFSAV